MNFVGFIKRNIDDILFLLMVAFFILGVTYSVIYMYIFFGLLLLYYSIKEGGRGIFFVIFLISSGVFLGYVFYHYGNNGKYAVMIAGIVYIIFVLYKKYKEQ